MINLHLNPYFLYFSINPENSNQMILNFSSDDLEPIHPLIFNKSSQTNLSCN